MKPIFIQQRDISDCGVACLLSVVRMYEGDTTFEHLRIQSGTNIQGTSLLGLKQAAESLYMEADIFEVDDLAVFRRDATFPCILHIISEGNAAHYVVCCGHSSSPINSSVTYSIVDPTRGIKEWSEQELLKKWLSRTVLCISPTDKFSKKKFNKKQQWNWFVQLIKEDIPLLLVAVGLGAVLSLFGLVTAIFNQKLIDEILPAKDSKRLWVGIIFLLFVLVAKSCLNYLRTLLLLRYAKSFNVRLLYSFYKKLFDLPKLFFDTRKTGEIIARLNDTRRIQSLISYLSAQVAIDILVLCISLGFISYYSWKIGLVALTLLPVFGIIALTNRKKISDAQREVMSGYAASESHFIDIIGLIEPIKLASKENFFSQIGKSIYGSFQERLFQLGKLSGSYNWWNEFVSAIYIAVMLLLTSLMVLNARMTIGEFIAVFTLMAASLTAVSRVASVNFQIQEAIVAFDRMYEFAQLESEKNIISEDLPLREIESIQLRDISFRFPGSNVLLQQVNFNLIRGNLTVLLGEVGSGKSVLLQLLQKFRNYESGQIIVNNTYELRELNATKWRNKIGVVSQSVRLFSGTIIENVVLDEITDEEQKRFASFCLEFGFDTFLCKFPQNYLTYAGEDGCNLSGGQCQMIALMRALYNNPDVLLLDEPTSAMDSKTEIFVLNLLNKIKYEKIVFMVTHSKSYEEFVDIVVHLKNGNTFKRDAIVAS